MRCVTLTNASSKGVTMSKFKSPRSQITDTHYRSETTKLYYAITDHLSAKGSPEFAETFGDADVFLHDLLIFAEQWWLERNQKSLVAFKRAEAKKAAKA